MEGVSIGVSTAAGVAAAAEAADSPVTRDPSLAGVYRVSYYSRVGKSGEGDGMMRLD